MADKSFTVLDLIDMELPEHTALRLKCIGGRKGLEKVISVPDINRPGLALTGFFDSFATGRVQLFGKGENAYLEKLHAENKMESIKEMFTYDFPCVVFSHGITPSEDFMKIAEAADCSVLQTDLESTEFLQRILRLFSNVFAPRKTLHGVLVEVYGIGILLTGHSGVGKSECALELIERGHRLVADDVVEIRCVNGNSILGQGANSLISHHMEIRGLGIINVAQMYGVGSIREQKEIQLVIKLEEWDSAKIYDRVGNDMDTVNYLGVKIPAIEIPVKPGRNLPIIIEAAAMNERLKFRGYNSALDFNQNILKWIETGEVQAAYYGSDDSY
ncbi:HPr(Ser) kinase/phosphatase [Treponema sp.]|uniref:HPr(Ser) kinase/phosphatase n=1 Tax=Treponema sp. TaxID=166 RepID=UPI00388F3C4C